MENYKSTYFASQSADTIGGFPDGAKSLLSIRSEYVLTGDEVATDVIKIAKLPSYSNVQPVLSYITCEDPGTALVVKLGTNLATASINSAVTLSAGGQFVYGSSPLATANNEVSYELQAVISTATALTAGAKIVFDTVYTKK